MDSSKFAIRSVQAVCALLLIEVSVFSLRSGFGTVATAIGFIWPGLSMISGGYSAVMAICAICVVYGLCLPEKLLPVHLLALVPWFLTLEVMIWGGYWSATIGDSTQPRPSNDDWIAYAILIALFVSLWAWLTLLLLRLRDWWRILFCGILQLAFQLACSFVASMAAMNNWL